MLGGEKGSVAFHGDHRPAKVATHRKSRNLLDISGIVNGSIESNGTIVSNASNRLRCSLFEIEPSKDYVSSASFTASSNLANAIICFYDESMKMLSRTIGNVGRSVTSDAAAKFACISYYGNDSTKVTPLDVLQAQFELGSTATDFEPYGTIEQVISEPSESTQEGTMLTFDRTYNHVAEVSVFGESVQDGTPTPDSPVPIVSRASACVETSDANGSKTSTTDLTALLDGRELRSLPDGTRDELVVHRDGRVELVQRVGRERMYSSYTNGVAQQAGEGYIVYSKEYDTPSANWGNGGRCTHFTNGDGVKGDASYRIGDGNNWVYIYTTDQDVVSNPSAWFASHEVYFDYPLATPQTIQLPSIDPLPTFHPYTFIDGNGADISAMVRIMP